eukprot:COSAG01_NODE_70930_length_257_cov_0.841772_1_plen_52_part_10
MYSRLTLLNAAVGGWRSAVGGQRLAVGGVAVHRIPHIMTHSTSATASMCAGP